MTMLSSSTPSSFQSDKIILKNLQLDCVIGCRPTERTHTQPIIINAELTVPKTPAYHTDNIEDAINYQLIYQRILDIVSKSEPALIESLIETIAKTLISEFRLFHIKLRIEKPHALKQAESVGFEICRSPEEYGSELPI